MRRPASCEGCSYFRHTPEHKPEGGNCLRSCPGTAEREKTIVFWPDVRRTSRCARGVAIGDGTGPGVVRCFECVFWWQPNGEAIKPEGRFGMTKEWWEATGLCILAAPHPSRERPQRAIEWHVTHADQGCGDGEPVPQPPEPASTVTDLRVSPPAALAPPLASAHQA